MLSNKLCLSMFTTNFFQWCLMYTGCKNTSRTELGVGIARVLDILKCSATPLSFGICDRGYEHGHSPATTSLAIGFSPLSQSLGCALGFKWPVSSGCLSPQVASSGDKFKKTWLLQTFRGGSGGTASQVPGVPDVVLLLPSEGWTLPWQTRGSSISC